MTVVISGAAAVRAEGLFAEAAGVLTPGEDGREWFVFHAKPRREKKAAELLDDMELPHYLPLRERVTRKGKGRYSFQVPLFPGYLFGCCDIGERLQTMRSGHMVRWIEVVDQQRLLSELTDIYVASAGGTGVELFPRLQRGRWVRVVAGPLAGVRGRISKRKARYRVVLELTALSAAVGVEVDMQDVELAVGEEEYSDTEVLP